MKNQSGSHPSTIRTILQYVRRYAGYVALSLLLAMVTVALTLYLPILTGEAVDCIVGAGQVDFFRMRGILLRGAVVIAATAAAQWVMSLCNNKITYGVVRDIRAVAFCHLQELPLAYIDRTAHGDVVSRIVADADQFADGLLMGFTQLFTGVLTILGTLVILFSKNVTISCVVVLITPISLFAASFIARRTYAMFRKQSETRGTQTALINELVGNQQVVQAYGREEATVAQFDTINQQLQKYTLRAIFFSSLTNPVTRFVNGLVYAGVGTFGALAAIRGALTVGELSCFLSYANQYTKPFNEISGVITELQNAFACAARIFELIDEPAQSPDAPDAAQLTDIHGHVTLDRVYFSYAPDRKLIEDLCLDVQPGQRIAIVGPTGCGKTTLINLLMRFYDVDQGAIRVEEQDIRHLTRHSLRTAYGMVLQETWLQSGTIRENIRMADPDASDEAVEAAAKAAHAHSFIRRLPDGYDTVIGEDGGTLSQGQKQLLCIARVMLRMPPMLILDEATSSIDTRTEMQIQRAFERMMQGRTSFIVAHRLSTIREADVILVMKDGHIIEQGTHPALLAQNGFYAQLYNSQFAH